MLKEIFDRDRAKIGEVRIDDNYADVTFNNQDTISMNVEEWNQFKNRQGYMYAEELGQLNIFDL